MTHSCFIFSFLSFYSTKEIYQNQNLFLNLFKKIENLFDEWKKMSKNLIFLTFIEFYNEKKIFNLRGIHNFLNFDKFWIFKWLFYHESRENHLFVYFKKIYFLVMRTLTDFLVDVLWWKPRMFQQGENYCCFFITKIRTKIFRTMYPLS